MTKQEVRDYFLSKPGAIESMPFKTPVPVYKVGNKMFGLVNIHEERESINLKYPKETIHEVRGLFKEVIPGYHMNKDHWTTIYLDGELEEHFIKELIDISYELVLRSLTKKVRQTIIG